MRSQFSMSSSLCRSSHSKTRCRARHLPRHLARLNVDDGTVLVVAHVEVRRIVAGQVHRDDDSVEVANLWHNVSFYCSVGAKLSNCFQLLCDYRVKSYESGPRCADFVIFARCNALRRQAAPFTPPSPPASRRRRPRPYRACGPAGTAARSCSCPAGCRWPSAPGREPRSLSVFLSVPFTVLSCLRG